MTNGDRFLHPERDQLTKTGIRLEYATLGWNVLGMTILLVTALKAHSTALAGFGLDSLIEIGASTVVIWELTGTGKDREKKALRLIGIAFFALAVYLLLQSAYALYFQIRPETSPVGILWLGLTLMVMVALAQGKRVIGTKLDNPVLLTEGRVTMVDADLAGAVLVGLILNASLGLWWADPLASLVLVAYGIKEGAHAWRDRGNG